MKFSIVIPVYNVEGYIEKCLNSIKIQTYSNFEVIIVNDGSPDNSEKKIKTFLKDKRFKYYKKENGGLSDARNYGIKYTTGDYLLFLDSDDYIDKKMLEELNKAIALSAAEMIKFNFTDVIDGLEYKHFERISTSKVTNIQELLSFDYFEPACGYCYNLEFYKENNFQFAVGRYHEDYGLIPLILCKAKSIYYLNYFGYYYVKRENSIVNSNEKTDKKAFDTLYFSINNIKIIKEHLKIDQNTKKYLLSFYANGAIYKLRTVNKSQEYIKQLKENKTYHYLLDTNYKQKIKKFICRISYNLYIKFF